MVHHFVLAAQQRGERVGVSGSDRVVDAGGVCSCGVRWHPAFGLRGRFRSLSLWERAGVRGIPPWSRALWALTLTLSQGERGPGRCVVVNTGRGHHLVEAGERLGLALGVELLP